jgi:hypothetical protein
MTSILFNTPEMIEKKRKAKEEWIKKGKPTETLSDIINHIEEEAIHKRYCSQWDEDSKIYVESSECFCEKSLTDEYIPKINWLYKMKLSGLRIISIMMKRK